MEDLKKIVAKNITALRVSTGMTQSDLGEQLLYSDKSISKWERGDALPDVIVLKKMSTIFGVTVDYLLQDHGDDKVGVRVPSRMKYSRSMVTLLSVAGVWAVALFTFVVIWILGNFFWQIFVYAIPVSFLLWLIFNSVWNGGHRNWLPISGMIIGLVASVYLSFLEQNWWQLFLLIPVAELIIFLSFRIRKKPGKWRSSTDSRE